jgi:hypothetical protein
MALLFDEIGYSAAAAAAALREIDQTKLAAPREDLPRSGNLVRL